MPGAFDHALLAKVGEMLRDLGLRNAENFLEVADAERTARKQMDDPQSRGVAETLVNLNQFHGRNMAFRIYLSINILIITNIIRHTTRTSRG